VALNKNHTGYMQHCLARAVKFWLFAGQHKSVTDQRKLLMFLSAKWQFPWVMSFRMRVLIKLHTRFTIRVRVDKMSVYTYKLIHMVFVCSVAKLHTPPSCRLRL